MRMRQKDNTSIGFKTQHNNCLIWECVLYFGHGAIVYYKVLTSHYIRWEVVQMKFDFKDLMEFGMFILALLTLIVLISQ